MKFINNNIICIILNQLFFVILRIISFLSCSAISAKSNTIEQSHSMLNILVGIEKSPSTGKVFKAWLVYEDGADGKPSLLQMLVIQKHIIS
jgi:hypothetical protein